jgi:ATP-dependent DNA ligase
MSQRLDFEGIVAKDAGSICDGGRTRHWLKIETEIGVERARQRRAE